MKLMTGDVVKYLRQSNGLKQKDLAKKVGVSQCMISRIEGEQKEISPHLNNRLVEALGVSEAEVLSIWTHFQALKRFKK
jgi:transcriptional regulator with XRE-family HTH domain